MILHDDPKTKTRGIRGFFRDSAGTRTQDPNIKSVVLYRLSYQVSR